MIVMKFGGTSVKDAEAVRRVVQVVGRERRPRLVVVSALSKVTDALLEAARLAEQGDATAARQAVKALHRRHEEMAALVRATERRAGLLAAIDALFEELEAHRPRPRGRRGGLAALEGRDRGVRRAGEQPHRGRGARGRGPREPLARRAGRARDRRPARRGPPRPRGDRRAPAVARAAARWPTGSCRCVGGFVGATAAGLTTTLGRGGSDFSAALFGAGLEADEIQIWTDVDGMLTADPRVVAAPRVVPQLSFDEASELAYFGAKVLHPSTILPAVGLGIPVRILNSHRPEAPGTLITRTVEAGDGGPAAIACKRGLTRIDIASTRMLMAYGFLRRVFEVFERFRTPVDVVTTSEVSVSVTIDDRRSLDGIVAELSAFADVSHEDGMAIVCAVGERLRTDARLATRVLGRARGPAPRDGLAGRLAQEHHRRPARRGRPRRDGEAPPPLLRGRGRPRRARRARHRLRGPAMRLLVVGHGRMGRLVAAHAPAYGFEVAGVLDRAANDGGAGATAERCRGVDVAVDFSTPEATLATAPAPRRPGGVARRRDDRLAGARGRAARGGVALRGRAPSSPRTSRSGRTSSTRSRRRRRGCCAGAEPYGAFIHEAHHAAKKDAPSGTALMLRRALERGGWARPVDVSSTRAGSIPGTHTVGLDGPAETVELVHTGAGPRHLRARGARGGAVGRGEEGLVHDAGRAGSGYVCIAEHRRVGREGSARTADPSGPDPIESLGMTRRA